MGRAQFLDSDGTMPAPTTGIKCGPDAIKKESEYNCAAT
jgi:hypothetical protein